MTNQEIRNQAMQMAQNGQLMQAVTLLRNHLLESPAELTVALDMIQLAIASNQLELAINSAQSTLRYHPDQPHCLFLLGNANRLGGLFSEAATCYQRIIDQGKHFPQLHYYHGISLQYSQQLDAALAAYRKAFDESPSAVTSFRIGSMLHLTGKVEEAITEYRRALQLDPKQQQVLCNLALALISADRADEAVSVAENHLTLYPTDTMAYANTLYAGLLGGNEQLARELLDIDRLLYDTVLGDDDSDDDLFAQVSRHLLDSPRLTNTGEELYTTRNGYLTEEIQVVPGTVMDNLSKRIQSEVALYIEQLQSTGHPWVKHLPEKWDIKLWGNIQQSGGYEDSHCHPRAVISGVLYVQIPDEIRTDDDQRSGWIQIGEGDDSYQHVVPDWARTIQPRVGRLILFPSYFFHKTFPFSSEQTRISVPVDIIASE